MSPHLDISRLVKRYAASTVLDAIDLRVERGSFVTIVGPSGCGKTTLLRVVAGLEPASGGTVSLGGERAPRLSRARALERSDAPLPNFLKLAASVVHFAPTSSSGLDNRRGRNWV